MYNSEKVKLLGNVEEIPPKYNLSLALNSQAQVEYQFRMLENAPGLPL